MASYTGLSEKRVTTHRSGFDISRKNAFTAKVGELLPVYWDISMPGDTYRINTQYFTRTQPVDTSAYTRLREYFDWYAVPLRLLWKSAPTVITQMQDKESVQAVSILAPLKLGTMFPSVTLSDLNDVIVAINGSANPDNHANNSTYYRNFFGFSRAELSAKLFHYLGYGNFMTYQESSKGVRKFGSTQLNTDSDNEWYAVNSYVNLFPLLAYQKIYQDFFRWSQWENANPTTYNVDYFTGEAKFSVPANVVGTKDYYNQKGMFDLQYCNWNKDMFMSILPNSQYGDVAIIDVSGSGDGAASPLPVGTIPENALYVVGETDGTYMPLSFTSVSTSDSLEVKSSQHALVSNTVSSINAGLSARNRNFSNVSLPPLGTFSGSPAPINMFANVASSISTLKSQFNVLALRQAEALQRRNEVVQSVDTDYRAQMEAQFGVKLPRSLSNLAYYIGGMSRSLDISEVVNQSLPENTSTAYIKGKGVGSGQDGWTYKADEPSVIMCIYHALPLLDYDTRGIDPQLLITDAESYPQPAFDSIGMETVPSLLLTNMRGSSFPFNSESEQGVDNIGKMFLGYSPRYFSHKTKIDIINGAFTTTLGSWVAPLKTFGYWFNLAGRPDLASTSTFMLDYRFFKVNPTLLDSIFGVNADSTWDTDQLLVNSYHQVYVARNLSRDGLPY